MRESFTDNVDLKVYKYVFMYIKLILIKQLTIHKCTLLDCTNTTIQLSVLYTTTVQLFGSLLQTHTLLVQTPTHDVSTPRFEPSFRWQTAIQSLVYKLQIAP